LYRYQAAHLKEVRRFERELGLERENAALGRAAAAIAHEVRNPLNTLGMGLQRLQMEARGLSPDEEHRVGLMLDAVHRANSSMDGLLRYARPRRPAMQPMRLDRVVEDLLDLQSPQCEAQGITVSRDIPFRKSIPGDPDLLGQVVENLLKNAVEAQPGGGFIHVTVAAEHREACLKVRNAGFSLSPEDADQILEPYYTTKTDGTGLGLSISRRIATAHGGRMAVAVPEPGIVEISVCVPVKGN
jgi:signal transduction histidine kinase